MELNAALMLVPVISIAVLGFVIHYLHQSKKVLKEIRLTNGLPTERMASGRRSFRLFIPASLQNKQLMSLVSKFTAYASTIKTSKAQPNQKTASPVAKDPVVRESYSLDSLRSFKKVIGDQQRMLNDVLQKIEGIEDKNSGKFQQERDRLMQKVESLEWDLEKKEGEIKKLQQQENLSTKMNARLEDVHKEFQLYRDKVAQLEKQAARVNALAMELEDERQAHAQLKKEFARKIEALDEVIEENNRLRDRLTETEDKLSEAVLQRQQFMKKVQLLEGLNSDFQKMSDTNSKLQNELRRIGELESMLNMISEERDLLRKHK